MIAFAEQAHIDAVKQLWMEAFGDSQAATDAYFSQVHQNETMLLDIEGNTVCAMLTMLPLTLYTAGKALPARYIYAVATQKAFRGQGRSTRLLQYAHTYMKQQGVAVSLLVPASDSLFGFYAQRGYQRAFRLAEQVYTAQDLPRANKEDTHSACQAEIYLRIRNNVLQRRGTFAAWDSDMLQKIMAYSRQFGAEFYHICADGAEAVAFCVREGDTVMVKEFVADGLAPDRALAALHTKYGAQRYIVRSAPGQTAQERCFDYAMLHELSGKIVLEHPYFNIALD